MQKIRKLKTEILKKELKAVLLEENEFENRVESRLSDCKKFWRFHFQDFNAGSGLIVFYNNFHPRVDFSIATLGGKNRACSYGDMSLNEDFSIPGVNIAISDCQDCDTGDEFQKEQTEYSNKKTKIEILQLEVKSVVMENL